MCPAPRSGSNGYSWYDYDIDHLTKVWTVTNAEDVGLCASMTDGAKSAYHRPGPFAPDEQHCVQFCDGYMKYSA